MSDTTNHQRIIALEAENAALKARIASLEARLQLNSAPPQSLTHTTPTATPELSAEEYLRYGRQLIMPQIGLPGQLRLKNTRVLIIGIGGLGCPAASYLSSAGVGTLGLLDHDLVELSNLHRQILHTLAYIGRPKVLSAIDRLRAANPNVTYIPHITALDKENALEIIQNYDLVLDCTDHPRVRYLVSDAAVIAGKTVVSASALKTEGQLVVVNKPTSSEGGGRGPCYRCYWPRPPPRESVVSCGEGGVLGPVVGVMGVLQALEAVKIISSGALEGQQAPASANEAAAGSPGTEGPSKPEPASMLFFSSYSPTPFKTLRMKGRRADCISCGTPSDPALKITASTIPDYDNFCGPGPDAVLLDPKDRRTVMEVGEMMGRENVVVVDTRDETQFGITSVGGSRNVPFVLWQRGGKVPEEFWRAVEEEGNSADPQEEGEKGKGTKGKEVVILCRRGNDSQEAAKMVMEDPRARNWKVTDVVGGIGEWARKVGGVVEY